MGLAWSGVAAGVVLGWGAAAAAPPGVVRIWSSGQPASGFVFRDPRHVLTTFEAVRKGRAVRVVFEDGTEVDGETVAVDRAAALALVRLERDAPVAPLDVAGSPAVGATVHALVPDPPDFEGENRLPLARVPGTVAAVGATRMQVAVTVPDDAAGAPLVDAEGRVVGLVRAGGHVVAATPAGHFTTIGGSAEKEDGYLGEGVFQLRLGWLFRGGNEGFAQGPRFSMEVIAKDRLYLSARVGLLFGDAGGEVPDDLVGKESTGAAFDAELGWRFALPPEIPLKIAVGAGVTSVGWATEGHRVVDGTATRVRLEDDFARPLARIGLGVADLFELDYGFELDVDDPANSMHRFGVTFGF